MAQTEWLGRRRKRRRRSLRRKRKEKEEGEEEERKMADVGLQLYSECRVKISPATGEISMEVSEKRNNRTTQPLAPLRMHTKHSTSG